MKKFLLLFIILISCFCNAQIALSACSAAISAVDVPISFNGTQAIVVQNADWLNRQRVNYIFQVKPLAYTIVNLYINNRDLNNTHAPAICLAETADSNTNGFSGNISKWDVTTNNFGYGTCTSGIQATVQVCSFIIRNAAQVAIQWRSDGCTLACSNTYDLTLDVGASATAIVPLGYDNHLNTFKSISYSPCQNGNVQSPPNNSLVNGQPLLIPFTVTAGNTTAIGANTTGWGEMYFCSGSINIATTGSFQILQGTHTTTDCDTGPITITPTIPLSAGVPFNFGNGTTHWIGFQTNSGTANLQICVRATTGNVTGFFEMVALFP